MSTWDCEREHPSSHDATDESYPDAINREIDHTRAAMAETLDEIQRRLDPEQVTSYVKDVAYYIVLELKDAVRELTGQASDSLRTSAAQRASTLPNLTTLQERLSPSSSGGSKPPALAGQAREQIGTKAGQISDQAEGLWKHLAANPVLLGVVGLAVGGLAAAAVPRTQQEDQIMGQASGQVMENMQSTMDRAADTVRSAAVEAGQDVLKRATTPQ